MAARTPAARVRLHREPTEAVVERLSRVLGAPWPTEPNTTSSGALTALWLSPVEWLAVGEGLDPHALEAALEGAVGHVTDATEGLTAFEVYGPAARDLIAAGCSLDLHPRLFRPGSCAQSQLASIPVLLQPFGEEGAVRVYVDVSLSVWLWSWLIDAAETLVP